MRLFALLDKKQQTKEILLCQSHTEAIIEYWEQIIGYQEEQKTVNNSCELYHLGYYWTPKELDKEVPTLHIFGKPVLVNLYGTDIERLREEYGEYVNIDPTPYVITQINYDTKNPYRTFQTDEDIINFIEGNSMMFGKPSIKIKSVDKITSMIDSLIGKIHKERGLENYYTKYYDKVGIVEDKQYPVEPFIDTYEEWIKKNKDNPIYKPRKKSDDEI